MVFKIAIPGKLQFKLYRREPNFFVTRQGDVHYIGGSEVLPPPLEIEKENEVISDLGTEYEDEAKSILIEHNLRLVVYIAKKFDNTGVGVEDLISIGTIGLIISTPLSQTKISSWRPMPPGALKMKSSCTCAGITRQKWKFPLMSP